MAQDDTFDLIVLGSGTAGVGVARRCRAAGWRVALVECREFGGTCALRGCEPKKTFWMLTEAMERARRLAPHGVAGGDAVSIDWAAAQRFKRSFTDPVPARRETSLRDAGIVALHGRARFIAPDALDLDGTRLATRHVVIATGGLPAHLPIEGAELMDTSDDFLALDALPPRLLLLGGGYISFEIAHMAARGGSEVRILQADRTPLAQFEQDLVERLVRRSREMGIAVELEAEVSALRRAGAGLEATCKDGRTFQAEMVVHGLGRRPALEGLGLEAAGVPVEKGRLVLDDRLRSTGNPRVFAAGDAAAQGPALTPVASHDARVVADNLLGGSRRVDYSVVPSVVFTIPQLASVGATEQAARAAGADYEVRQGDMSDFLSVRRTGETAAAYKILLEKGSGRILGAHLLGPDAAEVVTLFGFAMKAGMDADGLSELMTAYPSGASNISSMLG
ncbi:dihydrolipoyl dehydrogenase family protein [Teichococcus vastitatis]|uniref:NAD(P)/FAD-dependent oxidoreductase n=1 Tax=Teichococcus vastitatis TaxID=2307076 RepID=A0ABS9VZ77_9PROT|nr:NAD(P)/FAD-dependent oxidoreductase [Pseudoroseomonas vastitatis]MCI0752302.1 NAD(P)/FAD-dependent oxidoreductase [Pseudoroseomonas vastitatis]